jgi:branched-subunit amino acid ABC-type transport system permease component
VAILRDGHFIVTQSEPQLVELFFSQILDGLSIASVLLLAATGLAIVFGLMGVINLAHGEFMMLGAYVTCLSHCLASCSNCISL